MKKYINGASDMIARCICCSQEFGHSLYDLHTGRLMPLGPTIDLRTAFDVIQRLPHLGLRMREHSRRGQAIAERLEAMGVRVIYPGLPSHPGHERVKFMVNESYGFGGVMAIDCVTKARAEPLLSVLHNHFSTPSDPATTTQASASVCSTGRAMRARPFSVSSASSGVPPRFVPPSPACSGIRLPPDGL